jgi:hypothetical protein
MPITGVFEPLYGDEPPHWALGWLDLSAHQMHIFDSCPELQWYMWAEPVSQFLFAEKNVNPTAFFSGSRRSWGNCFHDFGKARD